jgi:hypothetical protein
MRYRRAYFQAGRSADRPIDRSLIAILVEHRAILPDLTTAAAAA